MLSLTELFDESGPGASASEISAFERAFGRPLPALYRELLARSDGGPLSGVVFPVPDSTALDEPRLELTGIEGVRVRTVQDNAELVKEWGYPEGLILDGLDGHHALLLVYDRGVEPRVVHADTDTGEVVELAPDFASFLGALRREEEEPPDDPDAFDLSASRPGDEQLASALAGWGRRRRTLRSLVLRGARVTDGGLAPLGMLRDLAVLDVSDTAITVRGLAALQGLRQLSDLDLSRTRIALDPGSCEQLRRCAGWLVHLRVAHAQLHRETNAWLVREWPGVERIVSPRS